MKSKIILCLMMVFALLGCSINCIGATDKVYYFDFLPMTVILSDNYIVLSRDIEKDNQYIKILGYDYDTFMSVWQTSDIYLNAIILDHKMEITFKFTPYETAPNFADIDDAAIDYFYLQIKSVYEKTGMKISEYEIIKTTDSKYVKCFAQLDTVNTYAFITSYNGYIITIAASMLDSNNLKENYNIIYNIIMNNIFYGDAAESNGDYYSSRIEYTEPDTKTSFILPFGWDVVPDKKKDNLKAVFKPTNSTGSKTYLQDTYIHYNAIDLIDRLTMDDLKQFIKDGKTRKDYNLKYAEDNFSVRDFYASEFGISPDKILIKEYNGIDYYSFNSIDSIDVLDYTENSITYLLMTIENGYLHLYLYSTPCDKNITDISKVDISDLETFMSSITYSY